MVKIITDSCSDLRGDLLEKYDIDYAKMNTVYEGETTEATLTWDSYSPSELYGLMRDGNRVTTTQVPMQEFERIFTKYLEEGYDIVYIGCSLKQSGSVNTAQVVARDLVKKYEGKSIFCIDSMNASAGEGILAIEAAKLVKEGKTAQEINDYIISVRKNVHQYCTVHSLDYLRKAGRVKASSAFFGNLMGVKPILISDADGYQTPIKKVKGRQNSIKECVRMLKEDANPKDQTVYFCHADCSEKEVESISAQLSEAFPNSKIEIGYIGPIIGSSIGPDAIVLIVMGDKITFKVGE